MSVEIRRGDIYIVDFDPPKGTEEKVGSEILKKRPAIVLSRSAINRARKTVVVVPISSSPRVAPPLVVGVPSVGESSVAVCDQITAIHKATRLGRSVGRLSADELRAVETAVSEILGLS